MRTKIVFFSALFLHFCMPIFAQHCENVDFEEGTTNHWQGFTGEITSQGIVNIPYPGFVNGRHTITSGVEVDPIAESCGIKLPTVEPNGLYSLRLGNNDKGREAERITHTFVVEAGKEFFLYKYAVVLEDPKHEEWEQPRFEVRVFDKNGQLANCGEFKVRAGPNAQNEGFQLCQPSFAESYWIKNWTVSGADLSAFVGQEVTVEFLTTDCTQGAHAGYAYVEASCKELEIKLDGFCPDTPGFNNFTASVTEGFQSYLWDNGDTRKSTTYFNKNYGDTISVTVTTYTGCSSTFSRILKKPEDVFMDKIPDKKICKGMPFVLEASGTNVGYFLWADTIKANSIVPTLEKDSTFIYEAYDNNGCPTGLKDTVNVATQGFDVSINKNDVSCNGLNDGKIELVPSNGTAPFTFLWPDGNKSASRDTLEPGKYKVKVADSFGCEQSLDIELTEPSGMNIDSLKTSMSHCKRKDGSAEVFVSGGTTPYVFKWGNSPTETSSKKSNLPAGKYSVIVIEDDGNGCSKKANFEINEPHLSIEFRANNPKCSYNDGSIEALVQGGTGKFTYSWSNHSTTNKISQLTAGQYDIHVEDEDGCALDAHEKLLSPPAPLLVSSTTTDPICALNDGTATAMPQGGSSPYTYLWSNGATTSKALNLSANTYYVTVKDLFNCEKKDTVTINPPPPLLEIQATSTDAICSDHDGTAQVSIKGGLPKYKTIWYPTNQAGTSLDSLLVGEYTVVVEDANGCKDTSAISVAPPSNLMELELESEGESYSLKNGSAKVTVSGGIDPYAYLWSPGGGTNYIYRGIPTGLYHVQVTDGNGCVTTDSIFVEEIPPIQIPNAFTPNGDSYNQYWTIKNIENYPNNIVKIYNRWGNLIFESNGYLEPWDGTKGSVKYPTDTYYYIIDLNLGFKPFTGYVDIIR